MSKYLIGLDIGTSGAKCIIVDETGKVIASSTQEYPFYTPRPGWAEQCPSTGGTPCVRGLKAILPKGGPQGRYRWHQLFRTDARSGRAG